MRFYIAQSLLFGAAFVSRSEAVFSVTAGTDASDLYAASFGAAGLDSDSAPACTGEDSTGTFSDGPFDIGNGVILTTGTAEGALPGGDVNVNAGRQGGQYCQGDIYDEVIFNAYFTIQDDVTALSFNPALKRRDLDGRSRNKRGAPPEMIRPDHMIIILDEDVVAEKDATDTDLDQTPDDTGMSYDRSSMLISLEVPVTRGDHEMIFVICDSDGPDRDSALLFNLETEQQTTTTTTTTTSETLTTTSTETTTDTTMTTTTTTTTTSKTTSDTTTDSTMTTLEDTTSTISSETTSDETTSTTTSDETTSETTSSETNSEDTTTSDETTSETTTSPSETTSDSTSETSETTAETTETTSNSESSTADLEDGTATTSAESSTEEVTESTTPETTSTTEPDSTEPIAPQPASITASSNSSATTTSSLAATPSASEPTTNLPTVDGYTFVGCLGSEAGYPSFDEVGRSDDMTPALCVSLSQGRTYIGIIDE
ncbi:hypothetical protein QQX98_013172 [Neonectria punicea]|uniref:Uncharacterized protein n=1 Tax=Neonectria punicea TaxID=979145 RepID=A0ABR1GH61_9HYPO